MCSFVKCEHESQLPTFSDTIRMFILCRIFSLYTFKCVYMLIQMKCSGKNIKSIYIYFFFSCLGKGLKWVYLTFLAEVCSSMVWSSDTAWLVYSLEAVLPSAFSAVYHPSLT